MFYCSDLTSLWWNSELTDFMSYCGYETWLRQKGELTNQRRAGELSLDNRTLQEPTSKARGRLNSATSLQSCFWGWYFSPGAAFSPQLLRSNRGGPRKGPPKRSCFLEKVSLVEMRQISNSLWRISPSGVGALSLRWDLRAEKRDVHVLSGSCFAVCLQGWWRLLRPRRGRRATEPANRRRVGGAYRSLTTSHRPRPPEDAAPLANTHTHFLSVLHACRHTIHTHIYQCLSSGWSAQK